MKVIYFIKNYAAVHAIILPGQIPGLKDYEKTKLLPCNTLKRQIYLEYAESCREVEISMCRNNILLNLVLISAIHMQSQANDRSLHHL